MQPGPDSYDMYIVCIFLQPTGNNIISQCLPYPPIVIYLQMFKANNKNNLGSRNFYSLIAHRSGSEKIE